MNKRKTAVLGLLASAMVVAPLAGANATKRTAQGETNGLSWQAESRIVGQTSTATIASNGDPIYAATDPKYSGVVALIMDFGGGATFICTGSLLPDRASVVTAAHCVTDANLGKPVSTTAFFYGAGDPDAVFTANADSVAIAASDVFFHEEYTGEVIDQNDIAVVKLSQLAPDFAVDYDILTTGDLTGERFNIAGVGGRSDTGGSVGVNLVTGRLRQGDNMFDFRWGDADFGGFFDGFFGTAETEFSYLSDFDNGLVANDASCALGGAFLLGGPKYCNTGLGETEVGTAGGDSGGPQFIDGKIAAVTSYGVVFGGQNLGADFVPGLNSSWGEFSGYVPTFIHEDFIRRIQAVPEPGTWAMLIFGFGMVGAALRRRRTDVKVKYI